MHITEIVDEYLAQFPDEAPHLARLVGQLHEPESSLRSRKNFTGHVTASAFIVSENRRQVLLLEHKTLGKYLQPGGHIEPEDTSMLDAALREVREETGLLREELALHSAIAQRPNVPFDINTHFIPANNTKNEPAHYHHDFRYVFTTAQNNVKVDRTESNNYQWISWEDFMESATFTTVSDKITAVLEPNMADYFRSLASKGAEKLSVIAVAHIIPSSEPYIVSLQKNFNLVGIIPKPKSINPASLKRLEAANVPILKQFTRETIINDPKPLITLLRGNKSICLIDIGGYFCAAAPSLKASLGDDILGIIEDTENGHQRYAKHVTGTMPIMSVARSELKRFEDQLVGHGIAHATETVLRDTNQLITYKRCGIIGYGKIGRGIAEYLQQRNIRPIVCEINPIQSVQAACDGARVVSMEELIRESDVLFCATGARALDIVKMRDLKKGAFLASATSSDDEFNMQFVDDEYEKESVAPHITRYKKRGHEFYLINDGNAVNFLYAGAVDTYISLVQGEIIYGLGKLVQYSKTQSWPSGIIENTSLDHKTIAQAWLDFIATRQY